MRLQTSAKAHSALPSLLSVWFVALAFGMASPLRAAPNDAPSPPLGDRNRDLLASRFFEAPIQSWTIELPKDSLESLRRDPREYVRAHITIGTNLFRDVGIHLKGSAGSKRSVDDRPALSLKFNRFSKGQRAFGCEKLHLNNSVQDPSCLHENLGSRLYRRLGIPTPRATHAVLRFNGRDLGLYVVKEAWDDDFIRRHFPEDGDAPGNLYEGGFVGDIDRRLQRDAGKGPADGSDLARLRAATQVPLKDRLEALRSVLDTERFLTLAATQLVLDDRDGYVRNRNNYRVYFRGSDAKAVFMPHGMDQLLGNPDAPVRDAWVGLVAQAYFSIPQHRILLRERMRELLNDRLSEPWLTNEVRQLQARMDAVLATLPPSDRGSLSRAGEDVVSRIQRRLKVVRRELQDWPDPLPSWQPGQEMLLGRWGLMIQSGAATAETNAPASGSRSTLHFSIQKPDTRASFRTTITLPAGNYRFVGRCKTHHLDAFEDQFGRGAAIRSTGSTSTPASRLEGSSPWSPLHFDLEHPEDGALELIVEVRGNRGEAWFDTDSLRIIALR